MKANRRNQRIDGLIAVLAIAMAAPAATLKAQDGGYPNGNTAEGDFALAEIISHPSDSGINNVAIGASALNSDNSGSHNTAVGSDALSNNDSGNNNTATGDIALESNTSGADNTATGSGALGQNTIGNDNTATGFEVLLHNTSGTANTASGLHAMQFNTTGSDNTASGLIALQSNTTGAENAAFGAFALATNTTGKNNTAEGSGALANATTGSNNVAVGFDAGLNLKAGSNDIIIGANVPGTASDANTIRIGKQGTQQKTFIAGISGKTVASGVGVIINSTGQLGTVQSSARFKDDIRPMEKASEALLKLKPVTFHYKEELDPDKIPQFGLIAEEVEKVNPDLVVKDEDNKVSTVRYEAVNAMLLNEFLKAHKRIEVQETTVAQLNSAFSQQQKKLADQEQQIKSLTLSLQRTNAELELGKRKARLAVNDQ